MRGKKCVNILLTSIGRRSYLIKYFKEVLGKSGEVHVSNSSEITPAFSYADKSIVTPLIYDDKYIPFLINYCVANKISAIIPLFDIDLPMLSLNKKVFEKKGIKVIVSDEDVINTCNDKWETYRFLIKKGFNTPKTYLSIDEVNEAINKQEVNFPVIIKPRWGMGSIAVYEVINQEELKVFYNKTKRDIMNTYLKYESKNNLEQSVLIQERLNGQEYGLDVINDLEGSFCNTVVKIKYSMRSGETDCAETINCRKLKELGECLSNELCHIGNLDVDVFLYNNVAYILEMNARFGGGYPFSHMAGVNLPLAIVKWLNGEEIEQSLLIEKIGIVAHKDIEIINISKVDIWRKK